MSSAEQSSGVCDKVLSDKAGGGWPTAFARTVGGPQWQRLLASFV